MSEKEKETDIQQAESTVDPTLEPNKKKNYDFTLKNIRTSTLGLIASLRSFEKIKMLKKTDKNDKE